MKPLLDSYVGNSTLGIIKHKLVLSQRNIQTLKKTLKPKKNVFFFGLLRKKLFFVNPDSIKNCARHLIFVSK